MANVEKGEFDVVIGAKTYTLTLKTAALMALQKHFSTPDKLADLDDVFRRVMQGSLEHVIAFFWACLQKYHPEISFRHATDLLDEGDGLATVSSQFADLAKSAEPDPADARELARYVKKNPRKAQSKRTRGTGASGTSKPVAPV